MSSDDRITCHVLDTQQGRPARGIKVKLEGGIHGGSGGASGAVKMFESQTDDDGRVATWLPYSSETSSGEVPVYTLDDVLDEFEAVDPSGGRVSKWTLRFNTASYFGGQDKTFFPEVVVTFLVRPGEQYHVPLLLSPYSYTTYRGS